MFVVASIIVIANAWIRFVISHARLNKLSILWRILLMLFVNTTLVVLYSQIVAGIESLNYGLTLFFSLILTFFTVFYDTYRPYHNAMLKLADD